MSPLWESVNVSVRSRPSHRLNFDVKHFNHHSSWSKVWHEKTSEMTRSHTPISLWPRVHKETCYILFKLRSIQRLFSVSPLMDFLFLNVTLNEENAKVSSGLGLNGADTVRWHLGRKWKQKTGAQQKEGGKKKDGTLKQKTVIVLTAAESCLPQVFPISAARQLMKGPNFPTQFIEQGRRASSHQLGSCFPGRFPAAVPGQANKTTHSGAGTNSILSSPCMSSVRKKNNVSFFFFF